MVPKSGGFKKLWKFFLEYFVPYMGTIAQYLYQERFEYHTEWIRSQDFATN